MMLKYKTGKLPPNFIYLGAMLLIIGIWRVVVLDWFGIVLLVFAIVSLFLRSGIIVDTNTKKLKKYTGLLGIKTGHWEDISQVKHLLVNTAVETQTMGVASISRTQSDIVYKLMLVLPNRSIELMTAKKDFVINAAEEISRELQTTVLEKISE